jgi:RNA-directed DNA polymerase
MKRQRIALDVLASRDNLALALWKAAKGKHRRPAVAAFLADADARLSILAARILAGDAPLGRVTRFEVFDPKRREITAACFEDRVLHHAILNLAEARFERALVDSVYACRPGKGVHAAVLAVQRGLQRWPWVVQVDVALMARILRSGTVTPGHGLPIGALTSQHLANLHLGQADRLLLAHAGVGAHVRYMDDLLWCCASLQAAQDSLVALRNHIEGGLGLRLKPAVHLQPSHHGVRFCGFRVRPGVVLAGPRKLRRARQQARRLGRAEAAGVRDDHLQRTAAAVQAALHPAQTARFQRHLWWPPHVTMEAGCSA